MPEGEQSTPIEYKETPQLLEEAKEKIWNLPQFQKALQPSLKKVVFGEGVSFRKGKYSYQIIIDSESGSVDRLWIERRATNEDRMKYPRALHIGIYPFEPDRNHYDFWYEGNKEIPSRYRYPEVQARGAQADILIRKFLGSL